MILDQAIKEVQQICGWRSDKINEITLALQYAQTEREKSNATIPWFLKKTNDQAIVTSLNQMLYPYPADYISDSEELEGNMYLYTLSSPGPSGTSTSSYVLREPTTTMTIVREDGTPMLADPAPLGPVQPPGDQMSRTVFLKKQTFEYAQIRYFGEWPYVYANTAGFLYDTSQNLPPGVPRDYVLHQQGVILYPPPDGVYYVSWCYWAQDAPQALGQTNQWLTYAPWVLIGDAAAKIAADLGNQAAQQTAMNISGSAGTNMFKATVNRNEAGRRRSLGSRL